MKSQKQKADDFRSLHHAERILVLPNAWDVVSARLFEEEGFKAVATTSGGVAASLGYPDGEKISRDEMLKAVRRIANALECPLSADMESGFGESISEIEKLAAEVISAGAVGINIEDSTGDRETPLYDIEKQVEKIKTIRRVSDSMDVPLVVNARTDAFLFSKSAGPTKLDEVIERARAYEGAGADCVFPFGVTDAESISRIVSALNIPINIRAGRSSPTIPELENLGVARASLATGPICAVLGYLKRISKEIRESGTYETLTNNAITYDELNKLAKRQITR